MTHHLCFKATRGSSRMMILVFLLFSLFALACYETFRDPRTELLLLSVPERVFMIIIFNYFIFLVPALAVWNWAIPASRSLNRWHQIL